jgi:hypothetical protein
MSRLKQLLLSFWCKDQGLGMVETAVTLPLFLLLTFGVMEFGSMYMNRYHARDIADAVGDYLQANPSASTTDLENFLAGLGLGTLKNINAGDVYAKIKIKSATMMMTDQQLDQLCETGGKSWTNPWPNGVLNRYYIHICYPYTHKSVTPLPKLTGGVMPETRIIRGAAVTSTYPMITCPAGQFINNSNGKPECTQLDAPCPSGQYLAGVIGTSGVCKTPKVTVAPKGKTTSKDTNDCWGDTVMVGIKDKRHVGCAPIVVGW